MAFLLFLLILGAVCIIVANVLLVKVLSIILVSATSILIGIEIIREQIELKGIKSVMDSLRVSQIKRQQNERYTDSKKQLKRRRTDK